jgi:hypothetical protein
MGSRLTIVSGTRYGRLTVIKEVAPAEEPRGAKARRFLCRCDCGTDSVVRLGSLRTGHTSSCGCASVESIRARATKHGHTVGGRFSTNYIVWNGIKSRCLNPKDPRYHRYGGKANPVTIHPAWLADFNSFNRYIMETLGSRQDGQSIDRIDNTLGYVPGNLRWADDVTQANNREITLRICFNGSVVTVGELARRSGISYSTIYHRLKRGRSVEEAIAIS